MTTRAGVLLDKRVLLKALRRQQVFERIDLYARAASDLGYELVIFDISAVSFKRRGVRGYVPSSDGRFQRRWVPLPKVVHNRALLGYTPAERQVLRGLERHGVRLFNPRMNHDKYHIHRLLYKNEALRPYLPDTVALTRSSYAWFQSRLKAHEELFLKPRRGSLGWGIIRIRKLRNGLYRYESSNRKVVGSPGRMWRLARRLVKRRYLLQVGIPLAEIDGYRYDLRVPVQKDATGNWRVPGMAAKRSIAHPFLTNIAQGGSALKIGDALERSLPGICAERVVNEVKEVALRVATTLEKTYPALADIGLDIGLDRTGHPFLIEVNRRDLRIILDQAGEKQVYAELYRNPLAYAGHLLQAGSA